MAGNLLMSNISQDERERAIFRSRRKFQTDLQSDLAMAEDRGRNIGRQEGRLEGRLEEKLGIARNALQMGMPTDDIVKLTGLNRKDVDNLRTEH